LQIGSQNRNLESTMTADTIFAGAVATLDPQRPRAEAIAVTGDVIAAVGGLDELVAGYPRATVEELPGTIVPGLIDSHLHLQWAGLKLLRLVGADAPLDPAAWLAALDADKDAPVWLDGEPALDERVAAIGMAAILMHALGVTGVVDPAVLSEELAGYREAHRRGVVGLRVVAMPHVSLADGADVAAAAVRPLGVGSGDDVLRVGPIKLYYDGQGRAGTALLRAPWPGRDGDHGDRLVDAGEFARFAAACARERWPLGVHVVGGGGVSDVLAAFAAADREAPIRDLGFTLIHAYLEPDAADMATARDLGVLVAAQPAIQWVNGTGLVERLDDRATRAAPLRSWRRAGVTVGGGSDGPYFPTDPRLGLYQARTRRVLGAEEPIGPEEALDADAALELYTIGAAAVSLAAGRRGRLAPGLLADLVALSVDPATCSPDALLDMTALRTIVGGVEVHRA
jgi:predicted amidohydrolase YtcJ